VDGPVRKIGAIGSEGFDFPVGKTGVGYMKIGIANVTGATTEFTAQYFRASAAETFDTVGLSAIGLQAVSNCEYWTLDRAVTASTADVTLSWNSHSPCGGAYVSDPLFGIRAAHYNTSLSKWDTHGGGALTGDASAGSVIWTDVTSFSPFALAALVGSNSPLPVMFYEVKAFQKNNGIQVEWTNLTERDLMNYIVERSSNGQDYIAINQQQPRSNLSDKESYSAFDAVPSSDVNYYRIKAFEISGKIIYSKVMKVETGKSIQGFALYPNPVRGSQVSVSISVKQGQYRVKVLNTAGQEVYSMRLNHQGGSMTQTIDLPSNIKPGVYNMMISGDNYREAKMFVVQ
ncbi:MAG TPA: T9SS type A sorting domain-containing protein, partial [Chitinophagaceae bacterium]|nr:T9SS type A sorting domain-containing protein [Chitinophagaceae bacterium]